MKHFTAPYAQKPPLFLLCLLALSTASLAQEKEEEPQPVAPSPSATCSVDVFYTWKRTGSSAEGELAKPVEVFFSRIEREGISPESARESLKARLSAVQNDAARECSEEHTEQSRCVAKLLRTSGKDYNSFDFQTRNLFLKSVQDECEKKVGVCLSTRTSEIACHEVSVSIGTASDAGANSGAGKSGDEKKRGQ